MITISKLPSLLELNRLAKAVDNFPITASQVTELSQDKSFNDSVTSFYSTFPANEVFESYDDLLTRSEQVQIMNAEQPDQPWEATLSPQE